MDQIRVIDLGIEFININEDIRDRSIFIQL